MQSKNSMADKNNLVVIKRIIEETIKLFELNLSEVTVLTEAASSHFVVTPLIIALSGGKALAIAKDSKYGKKDDVINNLLELADMYGVKDRIKVIDTLDSPCIEKVDIVTNLGFVRPINDKLLSKMKRKPVVAAMCEAWEVRPEDIDFTYCQSNEIPIVGVNEESEIKNIFDYVGALILKLLFETGLEVYGNRFIIVGEDKFSIKIEKVLKVVGANPVVIKAEDVRSYRTSEELVDGIIVADYTNEGYIVGDKGVIDAEWLHKYTPSAKVIHLAGGVDYQYLVNNNLFCYPQYDGYPRRMSKTFGYLGARPVIELHTAGLKAADTVLSALRQGITFRQSIDKFNEHPLVQIVC